MTVIRLFSMMFALGLSGANIWLWQHFGYTASAVLAGLLAIYVIAEACALLKEAIING